MKFILIVSCVSFILASSCKKENAVNHKENTAKEDTLASDTITVVALEEIINIPKDEQNPYPGFITYTIQKGNNYCDNNEYALIRGLQELNFLVVFDSSCIYTNALPENQADINKLLGFSDCETHHQTNSARFGWNWMDGQLYLYAYCYRDKERIYKNLGPVDLNTIQHCRLSITDYNYVFEVNGKQDTLPRHCTGNTIFGYRLLPYFGGDETAPHTIRIRIKYL